LGVILLHLIPDHHDSAAKRQVDLIAPILRKYADVHVATVGRRRLDLTASWRLRRLVRDLRPNVVHAWRLTALRAAGLLKVWGKPPFRLVVSEPRRGGRINFLDRRLLRTADAVVASYPVEADALRALGVPPDRMHELPPAVAPPPDAPPPDLPLPPQAKVLMCVGNLTPAHGFRDAVWAADILRYPVADLHLVIIGDGPDRGRLERFAHGINPVGGNVHFLPATPDAAALLARAAVVWVPSHRECGRQVLLEAMAAGKPVVASALPGLAALVADGQSGLLIRPGDTLELARRTRPLLENPDAAARLGSAAREAVAPLTPDRAAAAYRALYSTLAG
jgi:glycosyltransferase involved in cell wall biosynthesis